MLKIKSLTFVNIGRFVEPQTIHFDLLGPLVQVDGLNLNTKGSSGAGKSTIFNALDYLFGLNDLSNGLLQSRLTKSPISVSGTFDYDGNDLKITRSKKGLVLEHDGALTSGSSKLAEEALDLILGVSRDLFRSMLHKRQKEGGFFLKLSPKGVYDFLTDCLDLKDLRDKAAIVQVAASELTKKLEIKASAIQATKASLEATAKATASLGERPVVVQDRAAFVNLKLEAESAKSLVESLREAHEKATAEIELKRPNAEVSQFDDSALAGHHEEKKQIQEQLNTLRFEELRRTNAIQEKISAKKADYAATVQEKRVHSEMCTRIIATGIRAKEQAADLANSIKQLRAQTCFTCHQSWISDAAKNKEGELITQLSQFKDIVQKAEEAKVHAAQITNELAALKQEHEAEINQLTVLLFPSAEDPKKLVHKERMAELDNCIQLETERKRLHASSIDAKNRQAMAEFTALLNEHRKVQGQAMAEYLRDAANKQQALDTAIGAIRAQTEAIARYEKTIDQLALQKDSTLAILKASEEDLTLLRNRLVMAEEARRAIKSYTSRKFDSALNAISDTATRIIRQIPNTANATIELKATKETADGKINEEVNAVIHNDGEENVPLKSLSGGERTSADLAVDLAAIQFLEDQAGKGIDILILDEPFTGLDSANIEAIVEMLKASSVSKRIVVVDHNPVIAETFESRIVVKRDGQSSSIT